MTDPRTVTEWAAGVALLAFLSGLAAGLLPSIEVRGERIFVLIIGFLAGVAAYWMLGRPKREARYE